MYACWIKPENRGTIWVISSIYENLSDENLSVINLLDVS